MVLSTGGRHARGAGPGLASPLDLDDVKLITIIGSVTGTVAERDGANIRRLASPLVEYTQPVGARSKQDRRM